MRKKEREGISLTCMKSLRSTAILRLLCAQREDGRPYETVKLPSDGRSWSVEPWGRSGRTARILMGGRGMMGRETTRSGRRTPDGATG